MNTDKIVWERTVHILLPVHSISYPIYSSLPRAFVFNASC